MRLLVRLLLIIVFALPSWAQTYTLFSSPHQQFLDNSGRPLAGGRLYTYQAGTSTPQVTYSDNVGTANTNPVVLDGGGFANVWLNSSLSYKLRMTNSLGAQQWTVDNISGAAGGTGTVTLNQILPATGTNTINNGANHQDWDWILTGTSPLTGISFGETTASTNTGAGSALALFYTLPGSTVAPFKAVSGLSGSAGNGLNVDATGNINALGTATFVGPLRATNITGSSHCVQADASGNLTGAGGVCLVAGTNMPLSGLTAATTGNSITNGNNEQSWAWQLTGTVAENGLLIGESAASTNTGANSALFGVSTTAGSTVMPFRAVAGPGNGLQVTNTGNVVAVGSAQFQGPLRAQTAVANAPLTLLSPDSNTSLAFNMLNGQNPSLVSSTGVLDIGVLGANNLVGTGSSCLQASADGTITRAGPPCGLASPAGNSGSVQFNSAGTTMAGSANFTWTDPNNLLTVMTPTSDPLNLQGTAANGTTGALALGMHYDPLGGSWVADNANPMSLQFNPPNPGYQNMLFTYDSGVTLGNFTPTQLLKMGPTGAVFNVQLAVVNLSGTGTNCIQANLFGQLSRSGAPCATGTGNPGGSNTQVQYNNAGVFAGIANGTAGQVLTSNGVSAIPTFQTPGATSAAANTVYGNPTAAAAAPIYMPMTACGDSTHALSWVAGTGFACQAIAAGGGSSALSSITAATATNTIANASFTQTWNWVLTGTNNGMIFGEGSAGTGTGSLVQINAKSANVTPFEIINTTANGASMHLGPSATGGAWMWGGASNWSANAGAQWVGANFVARATSAVNLDANSVVAGGYAFQANTGLTVGNTFTPTTVATITSAGIFTANKVQLALLPSATALATDSTGTIIAGTGGASVVAYSLLNALCQGAGMSQSGSFPNSAASVNGGYCNQGTATSFQYGTYQWALASLAATPAQWADQQITLPPGMTGTYTLYTQVEFDTATSGTANLSFQYACVAAGSAIASATPSAVQTLSVTAPAATGQLATTSITPTVTGCSAGNLMLTRVGVVSGGTATTGNIRPHVATLFVR